MVYANLFGWPGGGGGGGDSVPGLPPYQSLVALKSVGILLYSPSTFCNVGVSLYANLFGWPQCQIGVQITAFGGREGGGGQCPRAFPYQSLVV